jgi:probable F420-dependent oxidoreductase
MTTTTTHAQRFGRIGIWSTALRAPGPGERAGERRLAELGEAAAELEELGYGALWVGGSPALPQAAPLLAATSRVTVGTSILSIWDHAPAEVAAQLAQLNAEHGGRLLLGLGVSHAEAPRNAEVRERLRARPYTAMRDYLAALDAADQPVPREQRALAALGPKMLALSAERGLGALPYLVTAEHTAEARRTLGPDALLAPELKVVLDTDPDRARATARDYLSHYLALANYRNSWLRQGFTQDDLADGGSDRLLDAVYALGDADTVRARVDAFHAAGADHVALQVVTADMSALPRPTWRTLATALDLSA